MANELPWAASPEQLPALPRNAVHAMIERLIDWLDEQDGDPDLEPNRDEMDGSASEDESCATPIGRWRGPPDR